MTDDADARLVAPSGNSGKEPAPDEPVEPRDLEHEIEQLRAQMTVLIHELDRRRHEATDVKVQVHRHPVAAAIVAAAGVLAAVGIAVRLTRLVGSLTARPDTRLEQAQKLLHALALASRQPDRLLRALEQ